MSRGLGEIAIAAGWLLVVMGTDFVQRGGFASTPLVAGASYALLVASLLFINQFPDRKADAIAGKRTLVVRLGADTAKWGYLLLRWSPTAGWCFRSTLQPAAGLRRRGIHPDSLFPRRQTADRARCRALRARPRDQAHHRRKRICTA